MHQFGFQRAHTRRRLTNRPAEDYVDGIDGGEERIVLKATMMQANGQGAEVVRIDHVQSTMKDILNFVIMTKGPQMHN